MGGITRALTGFQAVIALTLLLAASDSIAANSEVYAYRASDGTWLFTDHALKNRKYQLVRRKSNPRGVASRGNAPLHRADPSAYDRLIREMARLYNIDAALIKAVMHAESAFNPHATSHKGATGLMQLMPSTARQYGVNDIYDQIGRAHV